MAFRGVRRGSCVAACVLFLAVVGLMIPATTAVAEEPTALQAASAIEDALVGAIAQAEQSVVAIARVHRGEQESFSQLDLQQDRFGRQISNSHARPGEPEFIPNEYATGVVVGAKGLILTAYHVLREQSDYYVTTPDRKVRRGQPVGADPRSDLAVLSIAAEDLKPIKLGDATKLKKGQIVIALGNPYAIARDGLASASWGIVSNLSRKDGPTFRDRESPGAKLSLHQYGTLIQTDAKLNLGTSGGALVNLKGEMVGLTVSLAAAVGYEQSAGFALPVDETFRRALETLKQGREVEYGFLGVTLEGLTFQDLDRGRHGVRVTIVLQGTPADRAGLMQGDVITHVGNQEIFDADQLMLSIGKLAVDSSVTLMVDREGVGTRVVTVPELSKFGVSGKKIVTNPPPAWRGIRVDYATAVRDFLLRHFDPHGSVVITEVEENSPAWNEGLRPDMTISHVAGRPVKTPREFREAIRGKDGPVDLRLNLPPNERPVRTIPPEAG